MCQPLGEGRGGEESQGEAYWVHLDHEAKEMSMWHEAFYKVLNKNMIGGEIEIHEINAINLYCLFLAVSEAQQDQC